MALVTDLPENLPSGNDLDNVDDPDEDATPAEKQRTEVYLSGAHVFTLDRVPNGLERFTFMVDVEVYEAGGVRYTGEDGETRVPICKARRIGDMYLPGTTRPPSKDEAAAMAAAAKVQAEKLAAEEQERAEKEHNEPPMFDEEGDPIVHDDAKPADDEDQGDNPEPAAADPPPADPTVVQFSDKKGGK